APDEVAADRTAHFDRVAGLRHFVKVRRDFAVLQSLDDELDVFGSGSRGNGITALRLIAIGRGQADVDVLSREVEVQPDSQKDAYDARRPRRDPPDDRFLPARFCRW